MQEIKSTNEEFSQRLTRLLEMSGRTQRDVAAACGVSTSALNLYLHGRVPKAEELYRLATFFGVSMETLLFGENHVKTHKDEEQSVWRDRALAAEAKVNLLKSGLTGLLKKI